MKKVKHSFLIISAVVILITIIYSQSKAKSKNDTRGNPIKSVQQDSLHVGDTLYIYMQKYLVKHEKPIGDISYWKEGKNIIVAMYNNLPNSVLPSILITSDKIPFGAIQGLQSRSHFLYDTDGDGALDYICEKPLVPIWLVLNSSLNHDSQDTTPKKYLDLLYSTFQSDSGPASTSKIKQALSLLDDYYADISRPNRDIMYLLKYYIDHTNEPGQALIAVNKLEEIYKERYGSIHPAILLFSLETSINIGDTQVASECCQRLLTVAPDFVPGKYYKWFLMVESSEKSNFGYKLKNQYPDHWLIAKIK